MQPDHWNAEATLTNDRQHVFHSWSAQGQISPVPIAGAEGSWMWDFDGNRYLDLSSQMINANLGHQHPRLVAAIQEAAGRLCTIAPIHAEADRSEAARLIAEVAPDGLEKVFFTNGGAEATENAMRMARLHTGRQKILAMYRSYHGSTSGSIAATGDPRRWASEPSVPGVVHFMGPYLYRSSFHATSESEESERALAHLEEMLMFEGAHTVAAVILEPVVGTNGVLVPPPGYLQGVRDLCDRHGIVLIADEVMAGFGRCAEWFSIQRWGVDPDLICFAKGVNSGYVPLGGVIISDAIAATFEDRVFPGGLTYSGHPLACASAVASINVFRDEDVLGQARALGDAIGPALGKIAAKHPAVGEVRGLGAFWAIELVRNRETREMLVPYNASGADAKPMQELMAACRTRGVWPFPHFNRLHIAPPLTTSPADLELGLARIDDALSVVDQYATD
jgi:taurine---2-oxoglutarate transaminase